MTEQTDIDLWLRYLEDVLHPLPADERADIVNEARAHLEEKVEAGQSAIAALQGFGKAESYARPFLEDYRLSQALDSKGNVAMTKALLTQTSRSVTSSLGLIGAFLFTGTAVILVILMALNLLHPGWLPAFIRSFGSGPLISFITGPALYPLLIALIVLDLYLARLCLIGATKNAVNQTGALNNIG
ncbi:MAG: DUF1700 domain-containing protein [Asticcacaulis sp.]